MFYLAPTMIGMSKNHNMCCKLQDSMGMGLTPLHSAIYGYHASRVEETCNFIDELLHFGANVQIVNKVCNYHFTPITIIVRSKVRFNAH